MRAIPGLDGPGPHSGSTLYRYVLAVFRQRQANRQTVRERVRGGRGRGRRHAPPRVLMAGAASPGSLTASKSPNVSACAQRLSSGSQSVPSPCPSSAAAAAAAACQPLCAASCSLLSSRLGLSGLSSRPASLLSPQQPLPTLMPMPVLAVLTSSLLSTAVSPCSCPRWIDARALSEPRTNVQPQPHFSTSTSTTTTTAIPGTVTIRHCFRNHLSNARSLFSRLPVAMAVPPCRARAK